MFAQIKGVNIAGISTALPNEIIVFDKNRNGKCQNPTGVRKVHIANDETCTSDLAIKACDDLISRLNWDRKNIDALIFLSQTPDYLVPATACLLQKRLNLSNSCAAFDINLGCSGYVYGLYIASSLLHQHGANRILLVVGDTSSKVINPEDRRVNKLFGDAACVTALEYLPTASPLRFALGTNGAGYKSLYIPAGGARKYLGDSKEENCLMMNGPKIFAFALQEIPKLVKSMLEEFSLSKDSIDIWVMHQASALVIKALIDKIGITPTKVLTSFEKYGNTSSASIPLTLTQCLNSSSNISIAGKRFLFLGFGAGNSWGGLTFKSDKNIIRSTVIV